MAAREATLPAERGWTRRGAIAELLLGLAVVAAVIWFDAVILVNARLQGQSNLQLSNYSFLWIVGSVAVAAAVLLLGLLAYWGRSISVGIVYLIVGAILLATPLVIISNGTPLSSLLNDLLGDVFLATNGPMGAAVVLGAALVIAGIVSISLGIQARRTA